RGAARGTGRAAGGRTARAAGAGRTGRRAVRRAGRARRAARTARAGRAGADAAFKRDGQGVADHLAVVVGDGGVDRIGLVGQQGVHDEGDGGPAGGLLRLHAVDVPVQVFRLGVLAAEPGGEGIVHPQDARAFARDLHRGAGEHGRHIQVLLKVAVGAGAAGDAVAPVDKEVAVVRHRRHGDRLFAGDVKAERGLPRSVAAAQGAAGLVDAVAGFKGIARRFGRRAGGHRVAGVAGVFQGAGGDVGGIGAAVLGLVGVGGEIVQHRVEAAAVEVAVPAEVVAVRAKAVVGV